MPELPEVETVRRQLEQVILGKEFSRVTVTTPKSWSGEIESILHQPITAVERRAKILRIRFANHTNILIHLKMSGQLIYVDGDFRTGGGHPTADWIQKLPSTHTRVECEFNDGTKLFFNDQRIFGWMRVTSDDETEKSFADLAPDINNPSLTSEALFKKLQRKNIPIKQCIMDNQIVAGVGNIYACDALNLAKISPLRKASELTFEDVVRLLASMREVIQLGIELGGATAHGEYVNVAGLAGKYQNVMRVYSKTGEPCPNCGKKIEKIKLAGRGTFYCPHCQI